MTRAFRKFSIMSVRAGLASALVGLFGLSGAVLGQDKPAGDSPSPAVAATATAPSADSATKPAANGTPAPTAAAATKITFDNAAAIANWTVSGDVTIDAVKNRDGQGGALKVGPGGKALLKLRDANDSGKVELWVFEDLTMPKNLKESRVGPRWGLVQSDGRVLVVGNFYARFLSGDKSYTASDSDQKLWFNPMQFLGTARAAGWHKWTFDMQADSGLKIALDDKPIKRFEWNKTQLKGFTGLTIFGDLGKGEEQTIWVDDVVVTLGGPMKAAPLPPPPPPPITPAADPAVEKPIDLLPAVRGKHPRLLFTADGVPAMKQLLETPEGKVFFEQLLGYQKACLTPPADNKWQSDDTDAQRQGMWRLPTVALHYVLTGDKRSFDATVGFMKAFAAAEHWQTGQETDSGMGAANIMVGAALAYDWLYNDLDPAFRETYRQKLLLQARRLYYGGHLGRIGAGGYWTNDPQNNHRWHRDAGLTLCALAVAGDGPGSEWIVAQVKEELDFVMKWQPTDGTVHESPSYMIFGMPYLTLACDAADRCLGTKYLEHPFFKNNPAFRMQTLLPGMKDIFKYGDAGGLGFINNYLFRLASVHQLADYQAATLKLMAADRRALMYGWFSLVWFDPTVKGGTAEKLPLTTFFPDLGITFMRDGWQEQNVGAMFKCAPYGGYKLNEYRNTHPTQPLHYVNVAHDDPDANMFVIYGQGALLADDDGYSSKKMTDKHNTILIDGQGQKGEGGGWTQPLKVDMSRLANMLTWKTGDRLTAAEGEAAGMYNGLERYRRTFIWLPGQYILILDDIRAAQEAELTWLMQGPAVEIVKADEKLYQLGTGQSACLVRVVCDQDFAATVGDSPSESHGKPMGYKQLQLKSKARSWRLATVFDPWQRKEFKVEFKTADAGNATVTVTMGSDLADTWSWQAAPDSVTPSTLQCNRKDGSKLEIGPADKAELPAVEAPKSAAPAAKPAKAKPAKAVKESQKKEPAEAK